jgi:hypothetical protein
MRADAKVLIPRRRIVTKPIVDDHSSNTPPTGTQLGRATLAARHSQAQPAPAALAASGARGPQLALPALAGCARCSPGPYWRQLPRRALQYTLLHSMQRAGRRSARGRRSPAAKSHRRPSAQP